MPKRQIEVSDEILEFIADEISEMCSQIGCQPEDKMVEIDHDTAETIPLTDRIIERYTPFHIAYFAATIAK